MKHNTRRTCFQILYLWSRCNSFRVKSEPEDQWFCIAHLSAEDILKSAVIEEKKFKNIES